MQLNLERKLRRLEYISITIDIIQTSSVINFKNLRRKN